MEMMTGPSRADDDAELSSLSVHQLVFQYVDEVFSDYADRAATLPEVVQEIKEIIGTLLRHPPGEAQLRSSK